MDRYTTKGDSGRHRWEGYAFQTAQGELMEVYKILTSDYSGYQTWRFVGDNVIEYTSYDKNGVNQGSGRYYRTK